MSRLIFKFIPRGKPRAQSDGGLLRGRNTILPLNPARGFIPRAQSNKLSLILCGVLVCSSIARADIGSTASGDSIKIESVIVSTDKSSSDVSTEIKLTNTGATLTKWQLGFCYMQEPLVKIADTNPNLIMQICDANKNCADLTYQKTSNMKDSDLSAGYTTILQPSTLFPLVQGGRYTVKLLHSNQGLPKNYSGAPQNFFIIHGDSNRAKQISHISTTTSTYSLSDYDQKKVDGQIKEHIEHNWKSSSNQLLSSNQIVPSPVSYVQGSGNYYLSEKLSIHDSVSEDGTVTVMFAENLAGDLNIDAKIDFSKNKNTEIIIKKISDGNLINNNPEGYQIQIMPTGIVVSVLNDTGEFYALQTLRQLWNQNKSLPISTITDYPRFKYRGLMLDTVRHFFKISEIKKLIDLMAAHKLNTLHIHFSDDEGFRLELDPYADTLMEGPLPFKGRDRERMGSVRSHAYSTEDIQQLIAYANVRKITIIPEIDIPGHAYALIKSLPNSFVDQNDHSLFASVQGYTNDVLPVCTYNTNISVGARFTADINNIVNQVAALFDDQNTLYAIHNEISVGADEVSANAWTNDSSCQGSWANLTALGKGQKFFQEMALTNQKIVFSGWQQLVQNDDINLGSAIVPANRTGHIWVWNTAKNGTDQAANLAQNNYPTVLAFADQTYFDLTYTPHIEEPGFTWATNFSDTHAALSSASSSAATINKIKNISQKKNILGIEGALWSETLASYEHLIYMALPKMAGLAEASWSPVATTVNNNQLNWQSLSTRLGCGNTGFLHYLHKLYGVHYRGYPNGINLEVPAGSVCSQ